jgi:hypothetical protein
MLAGGVPKNFVQDIVVSGELLIEKGLVDLPEGTETPMHKYAIQLTAADARDGALSGSTLREACSWGKVDVVHEQMVFGEVTTLFPLIASDAYHRGAWKARPERRLAARDHQSRACSHRRRGRLRVVEQGLGFRPLSRVRLSKPCEPAVGPRADERVLVGQAPLDQAFRVTDRAGRHGDPLHDLQGVEAGRPMREPSRGAKACASEGKGTGDLRWRFRLVEDEHP